MDASTIFSNGLFKKIPTHAHGWHWKSFKNAGFLLGFFQEGAAKTLNFPGKMIRRGGGIKKNFHIRVIISIFSVSQYYSTTKTHCKINLEDSVELYFFLGKVIDFSRTYLVLYKKSSIEGKLSKFGQNYKF